MQARFIILFLLSFIAASSLAQISAPARGDAQNQVLADMSRRTGQNITLSSLSSQQWYFGTYDYVRNLGCLAAPASPPAAGNWQRFEFTYNGLTYIYVISDNLQSLILCNEANLATSVPQPTVTPLGTSAPPPTLAGSGQFGSSQSTSTPSGGWGDFGNLPTETPACSLPPRLRVSTNGLVTPGEPNWLHSEPNRSSRKIGEIPAQSSFTILDGPVCDTVTGMNYWYVDFGGVIGWTSEGLDGEYWLEPYLRGFFPETVNSAIVPAWANRLPSDSDIIIALSLNTNLMALTSSPDYVDILLAEDGSIIGGIAFDSPVTSLDWALGNVFLIAGTESGMVSLIQMSDPIEVIFNAVHEGSITAASLDYNNIILAVADNQKILSFWDINNPEAPLRRIELPEVAGDLEFANTLRLLIVRDMEGNFMTALEIPQP